MSYNHYRNLSGNYNENVSKFQKWLFNLLQTGGNTASLKRWENHVTHIEVTYEDDFCKVDFALWESELLWRFVKKTDLDIDTEFFIDKDLANSSIN